MVVWATHTFGGVIKGQYAHAIEEDYEQLKGKSCPIVVPFRSDKRRVVKLAIGKERDPVRMVDRLVDAEPNSKHRLPVQLLRAQFKMLQECEA